MNYFGLGPQGFVPKRQTDVIADITGDLLAQFGGQVNLAPETLWGQVIAIMSNPAANIWEALEAVYASQYRAGADGIGGIAVDNLLQLIGATRLASAATKTDPTPSVSPNGLTINGLEVYGTAGKVVPAGSIIATQTAPPVQFKLDNDTTIVAAVNALQSVTLSGVPVGGTYSLRFIAPSGNALVTAPISASADLLAIQTNIQNLTDADGTKPFSDVTFAGTAQQYQLQFGAGTPAPGVDAVPGEGGTPAIPPSPSSGARGVPLVVLVANTLTASDGNASQIVNINIVQNLEGHGTRGVGTATCTQLGAIPAGAGTLTVIGTPSDGWTGVNNPLDCITGRPVESDEDALVRRDQLLTSAGNATTRAIQAAVLAVQNVTSATCIANTSLSPVQSITFSSPPTTGVYQLDTAAGMTDPISFDATALELQNALQALPGFAKVQVLGNAAFGYEIRFNTTLDGLPVPLLQAVNSNIDVTPQIAFTRPAKSVETVVDGGSDADVAAAILEATAGGIETYGAPVAVISGSPVAGSADVVVSGTDNLVPGLAVSGQGVVAGSTILGINGLTITLSQPAVGDGNGVALSFSHAQELLDQYNNPSVIAFSRTTRVPFYIALNLTTDLYNTPGNPGSGINPNASFNPSSIGQIQSELVAIGNAFSRGSTVIGYGTKGLVGAFNSVPGIINYTLYFGTTPQPTQAVPVSLFTTQRPLFELANIAVSFQ